MQSPEAEIDKNKNAEIWLKKKVNLFLAGFGNLKLQCVVVKLQPPSVQKKNRERRRIDPGIV